MDPIKSQIRGAADILQDGSQDPTHECECIFIGIGFDMAAVKLGPVEEPPPPSPDPCPGAQ